MVELIIITIYLCISVRAFHLMYWYGWESYDSDSGVKLEDRKPYPIVFCVLVSLFPLINLTINDNKNEQDRLAAYGSRYNRQKRAGKVSTQEVRTQPALRLIK